MESLLELMRRHHEERERLVKVMTEENVTKKQTVRDQIYSEHRIKALLDVSFIFDMIRIYLNKYLSGFFFLLAIPGSDKSLERFVRR